MGRGDKRSKRGKISSSSYGNSRPKTKNIKKQAPVAAVKPAETEEVTPS